MDPTASQTATRPYGPGPLPGRLILLCAAYAPVAIIVGIRAWPHSGGKLLTVGGLVGVLLWLAFLRALPTRQPREVTIGDAEFADTEVSGYIISLLLPLVAASSPTGSDIVSYAVCAAMILLVAFVADLATVNPFIYLAGFRVARATIEGRPRVILLRGDALPSGPTASVVNVAGVVLVVD